VLPFDAQLYTLTCPYYTLLLRRGPTDPSSRDLVEPINELDRLIDTRAAIPHLARGSRVRLSSGLRVFAVLVVLAALMLAIPVAMPVVARPC
jgi:hypothetical protein